MKFSDQLLETMNQMGISQRKLADLTGIGKSSISQYLSGKNEPTNERKKHIALALGLEENFFEFKQIKPVKPAIGKKVRLMVEDAGSLMGKSWEFVARGLQDGVFPFGYAVKFENRWSYFISAAKFTECTGIPVPDEMLV